MSTVLVRSLQSTNEAWLSVYTRESIVGLRVTPTSNNASLLESEETKSKGGTFFCQGEDGTRITLTSEILTIPDVLVKKPDGKLFVRATMTLANGLCVTANTHGVIMVTSPPANPSENEDIFNASESSRSICNGGVVCRHFPSSHFYQREILCADGTRTFIRTNKTSKLSTSDSNFEDYENISPQKKHNKLNQSSPMKKTKSKQNFISAIMEEAPSDWSYIRLGVDGTIKYFSERPGSAEIISDNYNNLGIEHSTIHPTHMKNSFVDGQTKSLVEEFKDGRVIITWAEDGLKETHFPDGTKFTIHPNGKIVFIERPRYPYFEVDMEFDKISIKHSKGQQVPIALGGEHIRTKICLPDGTAVFIKYNTKVTAKYNGSIKIVRRSREVILAEDGGIVSYFPASSWSPIVSSAYTNTINTTNLF
jgi:hypothetical protein